MSSQLIYEKMHRRGLLFIFTTCFILGLASHESRGPSRSARSAPTTIIRRKDVPSSASEFEDDLDILIEALQSLKSTEPRVQDQINVKTGYHSDLHPSQNTKKTSTTGASSRAATNINLNTYLNVFSSLYSIYQPVLVESFLQNLPQAFVCVLADKTQCGWQADLTRTLSSRLSGPVLDLLSSLKSQTCPFTSSGTLRMADSTMTQLSAFQELITATLSSSFYLYHSDNFLSAWSSFMDLTFPSVASFISDLMMNFLQTLVDFLTIGLQLGVDIPSLDQNQQCQQGDLKQLLMWGMNHNINWSFGDSILNMFLALDINPCSPTDTGCQITPPIQFGRASASPGNNPMTLTCDQQDVTQLNDTLCSDILANLSQVPDVLYGVCKSLSTLSHSELIQVWKNTCEMVQLVFSPLLEPCPSLPPQSSRRMARAALSLSQMFCNYDNWTTVEAIDPALVTMCSDNDPEAFLQGVCNNVPVMQHLIANPSNAWVWEYCANASDRYMIVQYCFYETWSPQTLEPSIVVLCWNNDQMRMETFLCQSLDFYITVFSNPENSWLKPNCSEVPTTAPVDIHTLVAESCRYSEWRNLKTITIDTISLCIQNDEFRFVHEVCANSTILSALLLNDANVWVGAYCAIIIKNPPTSPPALSSITVSPIPPPYPSSVTSTTSSNTTGPLVPSSTMSIISVSPTNSLTDMTGTSTIALSSKTLNISSSSLPQTVMPTVSSLTLSPTAPLTFLSTESIISISPTKVLPVASSSTLFSPVSSIVSPTISSIFSSSKTPPLTVLSTVFSSTLSALAPSTAPPVVYSSSTSSTTISAKISATVSTTALPPISSSVFQTISSTVSSLPLSPTAPLTFSSTGSIKNSLTVSTTALPPIYSTVFQTISSTVSSLPLSPTAPLTFSSTGSIKTSATVSTAGLLSTSSAVFPTISPTVSSMMISPTTLPTTPPAIPSIADLCKYSSWGFSLLDSSIVGLCWQLDMAAFDLNVCCNTSLFEHLILNPENQWLKSVCHSNDTTDLLSQVCLYADWRQPSIVDMADLALCADLDTVNFIQKVCNNTVVLQNLLANLDNIWLLEQCTNLTKSNSSLMGFVPSTECRYSSWATTFPDAALLALCWDYDQANFISSICMNPAMLSYIIKEPSSLWVSTMCTTFTNYTKIPKNNTTSTTTNASNDAGPCLVKELLDRFNWSCSIDVTSACQAGITQLQGLQLVFRCGVEVLLPRFQTMEPQVAPVIRQATSVWVVLLLVLEENAMTTLRVTENIQQSVLDSVSTYLERETNFDNKQVLLQCFGKLLTSLMQTGRDATSSTSFLIKEYFRIPLASLRAVFTAVDPSTMRQILQYFSRNQATLQLSDEYLRTLVNVLILVQLRQDPTLLIDMSPLLNMATPEDIISLPPLQNNVNVVNFINSIINSLSLEQRQSFGLWFSQSVGQANMTSGGLSFIRDNGNLITYLPFLSFQQLSPAQLLNGLDILMRNDLGTLKQQFIAQSVIAAYKNLTMDQFKRLGTLTCQAKLNDLLGYVGTDVFPVIQENIRTCVSQGISITSTMISSLSLNSSDVQSPTSLSSEKISQLAPFLPLLGSNFLQQLSPAQLKPALSVLESVPFSPVQAAVIIDKLSLNLSVSGSGALSTLRFLASGVSVETLWGLPSDVLLSALSNFSQYSPQLTPPQLNAISSKVWGNPSVVGSLNNLDPLLFSTPLLNVIPRTTLILFNGSSPYTRTWNTQQAKTLFNSALISMRSLSTQQFMTLGTVAQGVSCKVLVQLIQNNPTVSSMRDILRVLKKQPVSLHPSLKKCVIEELYKFAFFSDLLGDMSAEIALSIPMSTIKKFSVAMMDTLRNIIVQDPQHFLLMPSTKQAILVDKIVQRLDMRTGKYTEEEFRSLGIMAPFVVDEVFAQLDRTFLLNNMEFLRGFCYDSSKQDMIASMLLESSTFGPIQTWTAATINQVDRFLFYVSRENLQLLSSDLLNQERIERLFSSQRQWESGAVGSLCVQESSVIFNKQQFLLQYFLGFLKPGRNVSPVLTCESLHLTQPSAWPISSITDMSSTSFKRCLELIGQDPYFSPFQLSLLLRKTKDVYGAVSTFSPFLTAQLGNIATQLSVEELALLNLSDIRTVSPLGAVISWTKKQSGVLFSAMLNSTKKNPSQLDSSSFIALGNIICGIDAATIRKLNPVEFSKASLWLGQLNLTCSEDQLQAIITLLSHSLAFGPISSWGPEVFIEIGAFAAGIPDMAMSAMVKEQIEGITPLAMSLIPANKFAVVFNQVQISGFSYEQAAAITPAQRSTLSAVQETALSMVLNPLDDKPVDFRGRSFGVATAVSPLCHLCSLLVLLLTFLISGPL
uniref:Stereocilin 1 n=1 Tax=Astyanax mexicanus TaxID=7994 RepID=W5LJ55_ASTMX